ncbi:4-hydroxybenzoyl-CoA reductase subunit beta [Rhodoblastus sphagnicola]|uniref:4-hydroxybenzoyl-CoA reductase subunit beta n=1 Tax=Rhodoblastus sphagnicola TaxID=333368 RepID=A0A2S6MX28_9HYPH|nr:4-hydroxybenzoyl-CoA reductase subunit beta [Rhodoblastus sphagnicola]MBB4199253.1 4-hydroxybenzoyl-CoA reductase subunit beta [Rhodoblastus sphagnicola]PPQ26922.1 4-hydroxybenzoyl-CoA reductase subunit beta [Rhodoblastus sphagnicola]
MNILPDFRLHRPATLDEAVRLKTQFGNPACVAGGTDLLVNLRRGLAEPRDLIDLSGLRDLNEIQRQGDELWIGALVTLARLTRDPEITSAYPVIAEAAASVAGPTHRAAATLGGNLCQDTRCVYFNQSEWWRTGNGFCLKHDGDKCHVVAKSDRCYATYHGDLAPVLIALGASAIVVREGGIRRLPVEDLFKEDGAHYLTLAPDEILAAIALPPLGAQRAAYVKARVRDAIDFPLTGIAVALTRENDVIAALRVAITGMNSAPLLVDVSKLIGKPWGDETATLLSNALRSRATALATTLAGPKYRRRAMQGLARRLMDQAWAQESTNESANE